MDRTDRLTLFSKTSRVTTIGLCLAAAAPFVPGAIEFVRRGIPDTLLVGDGAALELGTLHASRGLQMVGPYSRFGWSHPGPLFFYLAAPIYEAFGQRGPALHLFAFAMNLAMATAIVMTARQLRGTVFALLTAAFLAVYALVALPYLIGNEWNPIFPILPLILLSLLAVRASLGGVGVLPWFAFLASLVVQTHVGYAPEVVALAAIVYFKVGRTLSAKDRSVRIAAVVLLACWALPLVEAVAHWPGNLAQLLWFFSFGGEGAQPSWSSSATVVVEQMAVLPRGILETLIRRPLAPIGTSLAVAIGGVELLILAGLRIRASQRRDDMLSLLTSVTLIGWTVAVFSVHAIRGEVLSYLVAWCSVLGVLCALAASAWLAAPSGEALRSPLARGVLIGSAVVLIALALGEPVARGPMTFPEDPQIGPLARGVETYIGTEHLERPTLHVASREQWPIVVGVVLYLSKRGIPVGVEEEWIPFVGKGFVQQPGAHPDIYFGDEGFARTARTRTDLALVAQAGEAYVFVGRGLM